MVPVLSEVKKYRLRKLKKRLICIIDVANGNETKIMHLLDAVEYWYNKSIVNSNSGKKMASGGTFGEEDQYRLRELQEGI